MIDRKYMCGRFSRIRGADVILTAFGLKENRVTGELEPAYNIAPSEQAVVVREVIEELETKNLVMEEMRFGLIPEWSKNTKIGYSLHNIRSENVFVKPYFQKIVANQRCIIPASGFFEWIRDEDASHPHYFRPNDGELMGFAGLYSEWMDPDKGKQILSFSIITTEANDVVRPVHGRMPLILHPDDYLTWVSCSTPLEEIQLLLRNEPRIELETYEVTQSMNNAKYKEEDAVLPKDEETASSSLDDFF